MKFRNLKTESEGFIKTIQACEKNIKIKDTTSLIFKVNSILPLQNLDKHLNESTNLIMFVVHNIKCNDKEVMIYKRKTSNE